MPLATILSLIFFAAFVTYFFIGLYVLSLNNKSNLHRVFFCACLALCIWSFAFSMANSAPEQASALMWRRIAVWGWGSVFSLLLHCVLILTEKTRLLVKKWTYAFLYLPSVVIVFVFGYSGLGAAEYNLVNAAVGWVNAAATSLWFSFVYVYYVTFAVLIFAIIWQWGRRTDNLAIKKQAYILVGVGIPTLIVGTVAEMIFITFFSVKTALLAPILFLIPMFGLLYCIKEYGLANREQSTVADTGQILSDAARSMLYRYFALVYMTGASLNFAVHYLIYRYSFETMFIYSSAIFLSGVVLYIIEGLEIDTDLKDTIFAVIVSASVPVIVLGFIQYASITVWVVPFIFVILSVAFKKRRMIVMIGTVSIGTLIYIWIKMPITNVRVDMADHVFRLFIFTFFLFTAFYVNRIYVERLMENEEQVKFQQMLSLISTDFVSAGESNLSEKIQRLLQRCGEYFEPDRIHIFVFSSDGNTMTQIQEWCAAGIEPSTAISEEMETVPWWMDRFRQNDNVYIPEVGALTENSRSLRDILEANQIKSLIAVPIFRKETIKGFLCFDSVRTAKHWRADHQEMLKVLTHLLADAWGKVEAEREINSMAYYDSLTGLPNRVLLRNRLGQAIDLAIRSAKLIGLFYIDVDSFKTVNDTLGHDAGDALLIEMAKRLTESIRRYDTVARFGGDEFLIMVPQMSRLEDIMKIADKVMKAFEKPLIVKNQEFFVTASVGVAVYPIDGEETEDLIKNADLAMYASKEKGKNRYTLCSSEMKQEVLMNMELTNSLYRAQERNELVLYYQPLINSATGEIGGVEALIRWLHPQKGLVMPGVFIPVAEKVGLINPIGHWVLQTACAQARDWQDMGLPPIRMSVNMSLGQFRNPRVVEVVGGILQETGLDPAYLELEITEGVAINEPDSIVDTLSALKSLGVKISIDDFGTKYSSLSRLKNLPIDRIKIDMEFIHGISKGFKEEGIVQVILQLGKTLSLNVTAEGVETEKQLEFLRQNMCHEIQGYYYYKPMPADEIEKLLRDQMH
ncbi:MAG: EAL domain-containing protein [Ignavibacteriales bacterium]